MRDNPLLSIIIPTFNSENYIAECLESLFDLNLDNYEVIVIDDGSTDRTVDIIKSYDTQLIIQKNQGPSSARNHGIRISNGLYVTFLDSDDIRTKNSIETQLTFLQENTDFDIIQGTLSYLLLIENAWISSKIDPIKSNSLSTSVIKSFVFDKVGLFNENLLYCEDIEWFARCGEKNIKIFYSDIHSINYRRHDKNLTNNASNVKSSLLKILRNKAKST